MEFSNLSLKELVQAIKTGKTTQREVYNYFLDRIHALDPEINAFNLVHEDFEEKDINSSLAGVPIAIKDMYCEKWIPTTNSCVMLEKFIPPYDATVIKKLKDAGFSSIGKVTHDPFGMGSSWEHAVFKKAKNPWDTSRIPGGSSSGSAAAVASGMVPAALGTDTGWSCRQPGSMCGIVWFRPTYGRSSRLGIIAYASSLDTPGTLTKTVEDAGFLYEIMSGHDPLDSTSLSEENAINPDIWNKKDLKWMKIGVPKEYFIDGIEPWVRREIENAIAKLSSLGAEIVEVSLPHTKYALSVYYITIFAESSTNLARYDGIRFGHSHDTGMNIALYRSEGFGPETQRRIMLGSFVLSSGFYDAYYKKASLVRELIREDFDEVFKKVDVIVSPVSPEVAWKMWGEKTENPLKMYLADIFTISMALAGVPAMSVPCGFAKPEDGENIELPVWLQIIGPRLGEEKIFEVGHVFEQAMKWYIGSKKPMVE